MRDDLRIIDADGHTLEPGDLWQRYVDPAFRDRLQTPEQTVDGKSFSRLQPSILEALRWGPEQIEERYGDIARNGFDAKSVVGALDVEGVDLSVVYGPLYTMWVDGLDPAMAAALCRAYNRWLADYSAESGGRVLGAGPLPLQDVNAAVEEARYAYEELGLRAFWVRPNPINGRVLGDPYYDPLYATLQEMDVPLSFHEGLGTVLPSAGADRFSSFLEWHSCAHPMEQQMAMLALIARGALDRFPRLRLGFMESGCSWLPYWLYRMDEHVELVGWKDAPGLELTPTEYFKRQCFISCEPDEDLVRHVIDVVGDDNILFATDFPHPDAMYPNAVKRFLEIPKVSQESKRKILWDNAVRFYKFDKELTATQEIQ